MVLDLRVCPVAFVFGGAALLEGYFAFEEDAMVVGSAISGPVFHAGEVSRGVGAVFADALDKELKDTFEFFVAW